jgi:pyranose oxidase
MQKTVDILIIGSGPVGATFARILHEQKPNAKILMIDLGPRLTEKAGQHLKNVSDPVVQAALQVKSQGPKQTPYPNISVAQRAAAVQKGALSADILARAGTHLATDTTNDWAQNQMPAASMSSNLGGMGVHWTCACPSPGNAERIPFLPAADSEKAFQKAATLLCVTQHAFPQTPESIAILKTLGTVFKDKLSALACQVDANGNRYWVGSDVILGEMAEPNYSGNFEICSETLCRKLLWKGSKITGAWVEHLPTGKLQVIESQMAIVAADALRTPQLLWHSGIRPKALGHYLNEHPFIFTFVELKDDLVEPSIAPKYDPKTRTEPTIGVFWVPFDAPQHLFHGQIMHLDLSPLKTETFQHPKHIVGLGWGCLKEMRYEDCIQFSETEQDYLGMPKMNFKFAYTAQDKKNIEQAKFMQTQAAQAFGKVIQEGEQTVMPAGTSLHYTGTTRMGAQNDGTSVCDVHSRVWGFDNLFVGGNGVIPMATTSNPTLTSVAMAVLAANHIATHDWN